MHIHKKIAIVFFGLLIWAVAACKQEYTPKPRGYFRIELPEKNYQKYQSECPYSFEHPQYSKITPDTSRISEPCWINVNFPRFNSRIHLSYKQVQGNIAELLDDSRTLAYKHSIKADAISEQVYMNPSRRVYGILYDIQGNAASPMQFFLTDSTSHFLRGALYFNNVPNKDSLAPVAAFLKKDIKRLVESLQWEE